MRTPVSPVLFAGFAVLFVETTIPAAAALSLGQPQLLVIFLILLGFERYIAGRDTTAGVLLGLAAAIKVTPIILAVFFWLTAAGEQREQLRSRRRVLLR
jgi:uncharacterized membrane protein